MLEYVMNVELIYGRKGESAIFVGKLFNKKENNLSFIN
jgi:hypothetical protein